jgi:hypothetical protein
MNENGKKKEEKAATETVEESKSDELIASIAINYFVNRGMKLETTTGDDVLFLGMLEKAKEIYLSGKKEILEQKKAQEAKNMIVVPGLKPPRM